MRIVYMGTPDFAVAPLEAILAAGHQVSLVVTQPDKQKGRGQVMQMSPVKECALRHNIPVFQPVKIRQEEAVRELSRYEADIFVVAAFGQILSEEILAMPRFGCINIHASLLPALRGAAPIQWAIINGDRESGVTIQQMAKGVDTGDILSQRAVPLAVKETGETLHDKLMEAGAGLIVETLEQIGRGEITPRKQDEALATHVGKLTRAMGLIDWKKDAAFIERLLRGLTPWPGAYTFYRGRQLKIWEADVPAQEETDVYPAGVVRVEKDFFDVATGEGILRVRSLQLEGKRRMQVKEFLLGYELSPGEFLGQEQ